MTIKSVQECIDVDVDMAAASDIVHFRIDAVTAAEHEAAHGNPGDLIGRADLGGDAVPCGAIDGGATYDQDRVTCHDCIEAGFGPDR